MQVKIKDQSSFLKMLPYTINIIEFELFVYCSCLVLPLVLQSSALGFGFWGIVLHF